MCCFLFFLRGVWIVSFSFCGLYDLVDDIIKNCLYCFHDVRFLMTLHLINQEDAYGFTPLDRVYYYENKSPLLLVSSEGTKTDE